MALVKLSPIFNAQIIDENGNPANGWKINTYIAGTSTPAVTYTDSSGLIAQSNPIIINSLGFTQNGQIWLVSGIIYKLVLTDSSGVVKKTEDNISGVNDNAAAASEWGDIAVPTYISPSSYSLLGDQTSEYHIGRREKLTTNVGIVYGRIISSVFASTITTITLQMDGAQVLDVGLSSVQNSILRNNVLSLPERIATTSGTDAYTATVGIARLVIEDEYKINVAIANDGVTPPTLALDGNAAIAILTQNGSVPSAGQLKGAHKLRYNGTNFIVLNPNVISYPNGGGTRQAITTGPVDSNGFFTPGGVTGSATVTTTAISATAPLVVSAAGGTTAVGSLGDRVGFSSTNLAFTGLSINGTMFLYVDVAANGILTPGTSMLLPNYQRGGTNSTTNGQFTYNSTLKNQTIGNGSTAVQSYRVYLGEVTVAGGVVTAIIWYRINNKYVSASFANPNTSGSATNLNTNVGLPLNMMKRPYAMATNPTVLDGWNAGCVYEFFAGNGSTTPPISLQLRNISILQAGASASNGFYYQTNTGAFQSLPASATIIVYVEGDL